MQIAIPSYMRPEVLRDRTLATLRRFSVPLDLVTVFVSAASQKEMYDQVLRQAVRTVVGVPGLLKQRIFYNGQYPADTPLLNLDDDIDELCHTQGKKLVPWRGDFLELCQGAFRLCERHGARMWGINAAANAMFLKPTVTLGLRYLCGIMHGSYAGDPVLCQPGRFMESSGEDFETTLRSFERYGKVLRLDWLTAKTRYFAPGGMAAELGGREWRKERHAAALAKIAALHPALASVYAKAEGETNLRLKQVTLQKWPAEALWQAPTQTARTEAGREAAAGGT